MSSGSGADVSITLTADDQASGTIQSATQQINSQFRQMTQTQNASGRSMLVNNQALYAYGRTAQSVGRITDKAISLFNSYNLMQIRISQATQTNTDAQEKLAEAISQYGANSPQAQKAAEDAAKAQTDLTKATQQAQLQFALMVASSVAQSGTMITTVIPRLLALRDALTAVGTAAGVSGAVEAASAGGVGAGALSGGLGAGLGTTLGRIGGVAARAAGPAAIGVSLLSMMGTQTAGGGEAGPPLPSGLQQMQNVINIIVQDAGAAANQVKQQLSSAMTFFGGGS